ncbi:MAG: phenylalanine--tRNA ligase subunit beta [Bacteroidota bacterium]
MKISWNWLKEYIETDLTPAEAGKIFTSIGLEVEDIETFETVRGGLEGVVIGKVLTCAKHPNADKLSVTTVDLGRGEAVQIVCGAPNVAAGQMVPVATVGTTLYKGDEEFKIKESKIRGELSCGMICAEDELGLGTGHEGIMVLDPAARTGMPAKEYFGIEQDTVFVIGLTPNRIDSASHYGVARDLAAYLAQQGKGKLKRPPVSAFSVDNRDLPIPVEVENPEACIRYSGITLSGVSVKESPAWLRNRLLSIGLHPINNVVDITNFVLHEIGQPLHAFDAAHITGVKVVVKIPEKGTRFVTLDGKERELSGHDLMICNSGEGMCIAGVFGGLTSGVTENTKDIFLESACFSPVHVRKTARYHGLNTDASFRFERGSDPEITVWALQRAAMLIREVAGGNISSEIVDIYPQPVLPYPVDIRFRNIARLIGKEIPKETIRSILHSLEISISREDEEGMSLQVPPYRVDVQREADIVEEILRIYGFNNIEVGEHVNSTLSYVTKPDKEKIINTVSDLLTGIGFMEMKSNSLTRASWYNRDGEADPRAVKLFNPLSQDLSHMRRTLLYGGLEAVAWNINRKNPGLMLYEFGNSYELDPDKQSSNPLDKYSEHLKLGIWLSGNNQDGNWALKGRASGFFTLKGVLDLVLKRLGFDMMELKTVPARPEFYSEGLACYHGEKELLHFGIVKNSLLAEADIRQEVFAAEFDWDLVLRLAGRHRTGFTPLPRVPAVERDLSLLLDRSVKYEELYRLAFKTEKRLLKEVSLFDVYEGEHIENGKKSYALSFKLLDEEKTLTDQQIDRVMNNIASAFEKELGAQLRK